MIATSILLAVCDPKVTGAGGTTVTLETAGGCDTYTVSGACQTAITGIGGITTAESGDCGYTISGCEVTITGAGGITTTKEGDCEYTISGCEVTVTGGSGIVVEKEGCEYTVNAEVTCNTEVAGGNCIIVTGPSPGVECPEYLVELDPACSTNFVNPNWSLCGSAVSSGDDITFTASTSGCGTVTCGSSNVEIHSPKTSITGLGSITTTEDGECGYTISGCDPKVTGAGGTTVTLETAGGCDTYTVSGICDPTFVQAGTVTITSTEVGGCKTYTISGIPAGGGGGEAQYSDTSYCDYVGTATCAEIPCLTFGEGLQLAGTTVSAPLLEVDGTHTVCGLPAAGAGGATKITFADNVKVDKVGCEFTVKGMDQLIKTDGDGPECMPVAWKEVGGIAVGASFQQLTFADNIGVKKDAGQDCDYTIRGLDQKIKSVVQPCFAALDTTAVDGGFDYLSFEDNIGVKVDGADDCKFSIKGLDQKVSAAANICMGTDAVAVPANTNFNTLSFDVNMAVTVDDCVATIKGVDQKILSTLSDECGLANLDGDNDFRQLTFAENIGVVKDADPVVCGYTIKGLDQKVKSANTTVNGAGGVVDCIAAAAVGDPDPENFTTLDFQSNIEVSMNGCTAEIKGLDQIIESTETNDLCTLKNVDPTSFTKLKFANNIGVEVAACTATIKGLDQKVSSTRNAAVTTCMAQEANVGATDFTTMAFTDNIGVSVEDCTATVKGLDQKVSSTRNAAVTTCMAQEADVGATDFTTLAFTDNIGVSVEACTATIKGLDQKVKALPAGHCNDGDGNARNFTTLAFRHGFDVEYDEPNCTATIDKVLKVHDAGGLEVGDGYKCSFKMGCGMDATVGGHAGEVILKLKDIAAFGSSNKEVTFVSDICCDGQGFDVKYMTMTFSSCGQLIAVDADNYCS